MHCGYDCPACYGTVEGEYCRLLEMMYELKEPTHEQYMELSSEERDTLWGLRDLCEVNGGYCCWTDYSRQFYDRWSGDYSEDGDRGEYQGDPCKFNISKFISRL
jgi:hypothetical protein